MCDGEPGAAGAGEGEEYSADCGRPFDPWLGIGEPFLEKGLLRRWLGASFFENIVTSGCHEHSTDVFNQQYRYRRTRVNSVASPARNDLSLWSVSLWLEWLEKEKKEKLAKQKPRHGHGWRPL